MRRHSVPTIEIHPLIYNFKTFIGTQKNRYFTSVCVNAASAVHSALSVGFESAKIIGLVLFSAIIFKTSGVNAPLAAEAPIK